MYIYIYDEFTNQKKYNKLLYKIEKRLTDLGLNGKTIRLGISKNIESAVSDQIRRGAKTIVAVGNNETAIKTMNVMAQNEDNHLLTLGIIPLEEKDDYLADMVGIKSIEDACNVLLARRIETFKPAQINKNYFLFKAEIKNPGAILEIDKSYAVKNTEMAEINVVNVPQPQKNRKNKKLKLFIRGKNNQSFFPFKELLIVNDGANVVIDGSLPVETPARIKPCLKEIKIIVGKKRKT